MQALEAPVEPWFKPLAYALILLRENGVPSVFYPDLYGAHYEDVGGDGQTYPIDMPIIEQLDELILARQRFAHGVQTLFSTIRTALPLAAVAPTNIPAAWWSCRTEMMAKKPFIWERITAIKPGVIFWEPQESVVTDENGEATFFATAAALACGLSKR